MSVTDTFDTAFNAPDITLSRIGEALLSDDCTLTEQYAIRTRGWYRHCN